MQVVVHQFEGTATLRVLPLAAGLLVANARLEPRLRGRVELALEVARRAPDEVVASYDGPDVLAYSLYTWNARYSLEVARRARCRWPRARIVVGGPSVPRQPARAAAFFSRHPYLDVAVLGEGEVTFPELLATWLEGGEARGVSGLALPAGETEGGCLLTPPRARLADFSATGSPYLDGTFEALFERQGGALSAAVLETNRGCPFACTFCDWGQATQSRVHELPFERVAAELDWIGRHGLPYLYIVDANFGIRPRDHAIIRRVAEVKRRFGAPGNCYFHLTKNAHEKNLRTVETLIAAGIGSQVALSMQDFDEAVLVAIKRRNISLERSLALRRVCNERGIPTFNELLLGLPEQTYDSFCDSLVQAITPYPGDSFFLYLTRLLENAEMASPEDRERYGLETRECVIGDSYRPDVEDFVPELEEIVVGTRALPLGDWRRAYRFGYFLAALYNMRLASVALKYVQRGLGRPLRGFVEALLDAAAVARPGTVLAAVHEVLERYATAVLEGDALVLPVEGLNGYAWAVTDAVALLALQRREAFCAELAAVAAAWCGAAGAAPSSDEKAALAEVFEAQAFMLPGLDRVDVETRSFEHDWIAFVAEVDRARPPRRPTTLRYRPPATATASTSWQVFLMTHLATLYDKTQPGYVERVERAGSGASGPPAQARATSPRSKRPASTSVASSARAGTAAVSSVTESVATPAPTASTQRPGGST